MLFPPDGGPGTRDGPAWVGVGRLPGLTGGKRNAASRVPSAVLDRRHAHREVFHSPGAGSRRRRAGHGLFDPWSLDILPALARPMASHYTGAEVPVEPPRSLRIAPAPLNSCTAALLAGAMGQVSARLRGCGITFLSIFGRALESLRNFLEGVREIGGVRAVFLRSSHTPHGVILGLVPRIPVREA